MEDAPLDILTTPRTNAENITLFGTWAPTFDHDMAKWNYATPPRLALALRLSGANVDKGVLDYGCGTGLSGMALAAVGFQVVDGIDITPEMLPLAEARGCYRQIWQGEPDSLGHIGPGDYPAIAACDVIGPGYAPPEVLEMLAGAMAPGNLFGFSLNDRALRDRAYNDALDRICLRPDMELVFEEHGPHLPGLDLGATIHVLKRV